MGYLEDEVCLSLLCIHALVVVNATHWHTAGDVVVTSSSMLTVSHTCAFQMHRWPMWLCCVAAAALATAISKYWLFEHAEWSLQFVYFLCGWITSLFPAQLWADFVHYRLQRATGDRPSRTHRVVFLLWRGFSSLPGCLLPYFATPQSVQAVLCLLSPSAFAFGALVLQQAEVAQGGARWSKVFDRVPDGAAKVSLGVTLVLQLFDWAIMALVMYKLRASVLPVVEAAGERAHACYAPLPPAFGMRGLTVEEAPPGKVRSFEAIRLCKVTPQFARVSLRAKNGMFVCGLDVLVPCGCDGIRGRRFPLHLYLDTSLWH
jgi:hypothetical protein